MTWNIERNLASKNGNLVDFSYHWYLYVMNADHEFTVLDSVGRYINVNINISIFSKYRQQRCILKKTSIFFQYFYTLLFHSLFKVEFNIDHFVLGEHRER